MVSCWQHVGTESHSTALQKGASVHLNVGLVLARPAADLRVAKVADLQQRALAVIQQRVLQLDVPVGHALRQTRVLRI